MINLGTEITSYSTVQDLTNVSDLRQSGLYLLNIKSATYKKKQQKAIPMKSSI